MPPPIDPQKIATVAERITEMVRNGRSPDEAARKLATFADHELVKAALEKYRRDVQAVWKMREPGGILDPHFDPWYPGPDPDDRMWPAYARTLEQKGWPEEARRDLDNATTRILSAMWPAGTPQFRTRGLVVGYVQSGKTANFAGLIAKAADVGYKLFVVLSGLTDALRAQTQERLQQDLIEANIQHWHALTSLDEDFKASLNVNSFLSELHGIKVIGVVKKNSARLTRLLAWLTGARPEVLRSCPILIIDDEADQASPNAHPDPSERTKINGAIVRLLLELPRVAYVGYTATPFANFLIDPSIEEDLYPRDFIIDLPQGDGYFGAEQIYGRPPVDYDDEPVDGLDMIRIIPDDEAAHLKPSNRASRFAFAPQVTDSIREATLYFWMATAARMVRGHRADHSTMLIHTTQYAVVHMNYRPVVEAFRDEILRGLKGRDSALIQELRSLWDRELAAVPSNLLGLAPVPFDDLRPSLEDVLVRTLVRAENGTSADRIDYRTQPESDGRIYIVVGGNVLARGLTLNGLVVSVFTRTASAYDTLLQMGRWFGYRQGYADLPRVWMTDELRGYFYDLAAVEHEIRLDIARYKDTNVTPRDFAVRIRSHPRLAITAQLKMQRAVPAKIDFGDAEVQTLVFKFKDAEWLKVNIESCRRLIETISADGFTPVTRGKRPHLIFLDIPAERVIGFLREYQIDPSNVEMPSSLLIGYIQDQIRNNQQLKTWNVAIVTVEQAVQGTINLGLEQEVPLINRSRFDRRRLPDLADIKALMSELDVVADVDIESSVLRSMSRKDLRSKRDAYHAGRGLLLLYPIAKTSKPKKGTISTERRPLEAVEHVMGVAFVFPRVSSGQTTPQSYMTADMSSMAREEISAEDLGETEP